MHTGGQRLRNKCNLAVTIGVPGLRPEDQHLQTHESCRSIQSDQGSSVAPARGNREAPLRFMVCLIAVAKAYGRELAIGAKRRLSLLDSSCCAAVGVLSGA